MPEQLEKAHPSHQQQQHGIVPEPGGEAEKDSSIENDKVSMSVKE